VLDTLRRTNIIMTLLNDLRQTVLLQNTEEDRAELRLKSNLLELEYLDSMTQCNSFSQFYFKNQSEETIFVNVPSNVYKTNELQMDCILNQLSIKTGLEKDRIGFVLERNSGPPITIADLLRENNMLNVLRNYRPPSIIIR
jgi:CRISPR/Cas system CMR-associated protein Cmr3 (group 5 of RAMP superfamily)